jgi:lipopolysaccharide biosynthesis regulator YciM
MTRARGLLELAVETLERDGKPYLGEAARRLAEIFEQEGRPDEALAVLKRAVGSERAAVPVQVGVDRGVNKS